jgi:hypothetical protein
MHLDEVLIAKHTLDELEILRTSRRNEVISVKINANLAARVEDRAHAGLTDNEAAFTKVSVYSFSRLSAAVLIPHSL